MSTLSLAVVGAGRFGALHAQKLTALAGVRVVAVVDPHPDRARALAARIGARAYASVGELPPVDAATVAVPLAELAGVTAALLHQRVHVLAEKPLAMEAAEASRLVELAERQDRRLCVGFLERFNPALAAWQPGRRLVARRVGPEAVGPLWLDWLVHDLDLARFLLGTGLEVVAARQGPDRLGVHLGGAAGEARLWVQAGVPRVWRRLWGAGGRLDLRGATGDPLALELAAFCAAARGGPVGRLAEGTDGLAALRLVEQALRLVERVAA